MKWIQGLCAVVLFSVSLSSFASDEIEKVFEGEVTRCYKNIPWSGCQGACRPPSKAAAYQNLLQKSAGCEQITPVEFSDGGSMDSLATVICFTVTAKATFLCPNSDSANQ